MSTQIISTNLLSIFLLYKLEAAILFYPGAQNHIPFSEETKWLLHNFSFIINVTGKDYLTISKLEDQGIYGTIIRPHPEDMDKQYLKDIIELKPAYLCSYSINQYLLESIPRDFQTGMTAVLPCSIIGQPKPKIWWQKWDPVKSSYVNVTIQSNMRITPSNHLVIYKSNVVHSGTYRCSAINKCGKRCFNEKVCTGSVVNGPLYEIYIHNNFITENNMYFLLDSISNTIDLNSDSKYCFSGGPCKTTHYCQTKGQDMSQEGFFYGDDSFTTNLKKGWQTPLDNELCTYNCTDWDCSESILLGVCRNGEGSTMQFNIKLDSIPLIKATLNHQKLISSPSRIRFKTGSLSRVKVSCYHNNKKIIEDYHTRFIRTSIKYDKDLDYYIQKDCPIRSDDGFYFCTAKNIAGVGISSATNIIVSVSDISDSCYPMTLLDRTTSELTIAWEQAKFENEMVDVITSDISCGKHDVPCGLRKKQHSVLGQNTTKITNLTSGCCYSVSVHLKNGSVIGENRNVAQYMTLSSHPIALVNDVQLDQTTIVHHDNYVTFRLYWSVPLRSTWGNRSIIYQLQLHGIKRRVANNWIEIDNTMLFLQNAKYYGQIKVCNTWQCGELTNFSFLTPPTRAPDQPVITDIVTSCDTVEFSISDTQPNRSDFFTYQLISRDVIVSGGVVNKGKINIKNLKSDTLYNLLLFGENRKGRSETVVIDDIKTAIMCKNYITIMTTVLVLFVIVSLGLVSGAAVKRSKMFTKDHSTYQQPYSTQVDLSENEHELFGIEIYHDDT